MSAAVNLSSQEQTHLVRLITDRGSKVLLNGDPGVSVRVMNSLVRKGMAVAAEGFSGWSLSEAGHQRAALMY
jgi:hypothetical protein